MSYYIALLKVDPNHTEDAVQYLRKLSKNPTPKINLFYSYYVFGEWDVCMWFYADSHDYAMNFVQKYLRTIPYVTETYIMPTATIKEYK